MLRKQAALGAGSKRDKLANYWQATRGSMQEKEIRKRKVALTETLTSDPDYILQHAQQGALITRREYNNIRSGRRSGEGAVIDLLDKVMGKGEDTCHRFMALLQKPEVQETFPPLKKLCCTTASDSPIQETQNNTELSEYRMASLPRGFCLIFNNQHFEPERLKERKGSSRDVGALDEVFSWLGFQVNVLQDQTAQEMREALQQFGRMAHADCFVCCVLSHGMERGVYAHDGELVPIRDLLHPFNGASCPSLAGKPKVFFIQACQGEGLQGAAVVQADCSGGAGPETDARAAPSYTLPVDSDFLVGMATVQECLSIRNSVAGSWYIQSLCRQLKQSCPRREDILSILTRVNEEVSSREGTLWNEDGPLVAKQAPDPRFTLRKRLVFPVPDNPPL
ncbi:hypothetical protein AAFF_G00114930 [Aldrovandia affinis]|uniref:Caspase-8 n=1 Tax=Aldrovandia affinis TaxID=143900 RepID=A0AAD7WAC7_9TELE|nr:hypothetical protein AAFF_G00114930 [Aldrovandia affinis]